MLQKKIIKILTDAGYKLTRQRRIIIEVLLKNRRPLTALELYNQAKHRLPAISHDTLYRNLEVLSFLKVVSRINARGGDLFELEKHHHHHFTCLQCGEVKCLDGCPIGPGQLAEARRQGLEVVYHKFELSGYCNKCKPAERM
ncbi:MAG: transcriptional repressor [Firmicutes bacterium]|nr:transcriptional repressor [Bacillota bacterium]